MFSVSENAALLAEHWIDNGRIAPISCFGMLLSNPVCVRKKTHVKLCDTPLDAPLEFEELLRRYLVAVAYETLTRVVPVIEGLCLVFAKRNHNQVASQLWQRVKMYMSMPLSFNLALRTGRADLQKFVTCVCGGLLRGTADPSRIDEWVESGITNWSCKPGTTFYGDLRLVCEAAEIQGLQVQSGASVAFWNNIGVLWTKADHILVFLLLIFWKPRYCIKVPTDLPLSLQRAAQQPWLRTIATCSSSTTM